MASVRTTVEAEFERGQRQSESSGDGRQHILDEAARRFLESGCTETSAS